MTIFTIWKFVGDEGCPELVAAWDEYCVDANYDGWETEVNRQRERHKDIRVVRVAAPGLHTLLEKAFRPSEIEATAKEDRSAP